jgi:parallel beta-helix repeat protein
MNKNSITALAIIAAIIGAAGLGIGAYIATVQTTGAAGDDGDDGIAGDDGINYTLPPDSIYYVNTTLKLTTAISDIENNNYNGLIYITTDLTDVQAILNDASAGYTIDGLGNTLYSNGDNTIFTISNAKSCLFRNVNFNVTAYTTNSRNCLTISNAVGNPTYIRDCEFIDDATKFSVYATSRAIISNCHFTYGHKVIELDAGAEYSIIENNYFEGGWIIDTSLAHYCTISGNVFQNMNGGVNGIITCGSETTITGNVIIGNSAGIGIDVFTESHCAISGNYIYDCVIGIALRSGSHYNTIVGNNIYDCDSNDIYGRGGISVGNDVWNDCDYNVIEGNIVDGCTNTGSGTGYGVRINAANCNKNLVVGNILLNNDSNLSDIGTDTTLANNIVS